ncbi:lysozyme inhibitor LprI family protein [Mesorhizobium sp.]|uniref:lysozyme inhibitor LprI family protein n=1 Tax=Mesorhizobium sp. TaxID=1871066 RepID=UPI000FE43C7F|nr:lysozyme inhibitor LprI family protein [Mesorhizobium sp.]RWH74311.1 MAG: DUF1311 domain-containing protein [Mesorhizobium sp.]RWL26081.1 MAG: DUF1311 domain-containing protein [Mesorhizobium sp.]RWL28069.1 MAG: DUF1311 domain-containing protein [Mesorhizobium sp.]RWL37777.1 MAG: DUF1311 domain-containing protein [Mesorhizobium sp.]RWL53298.1 MAG: DUF1311 domain-containing protein [Mesorhizobium sp.]
MRRLLLPACLVLLATAPAARAQECDRNDDSQSMLNICADADYQAADAKLNDAYKNIVSHNDQASNKLLQTAQRAWIAFRDAECAYDTADSQGGSIHPMELSQCLRKLTNERTRQLASDASCKLSDPNCAGSDAGNDQDLQ